MPDKTDSLLSSFLNRRYQELELDESFVLPDYQGGSILNLPGSICRLFDAPVLNEMPLRETYLSPLGEDLQTVITILMDALSLKKFRQWINDGTAPVWAPLVQAGILAPLTSIVPSTTCSALTSIWSAQSTASHGIAGYEGWLKEYGIVANMLLHKPITYKGDNGGLQRAGFDVDTFLEGKRLGTHLLEHGVQTYAFLSRHIADSGLSRMHLKDTNLKMFGTPSELWVNIRRLLKKPTGKKRFIWVYWGEVDHYGHQYGPDDERVSAEFASFSRDFERNFLEPLGKQPLNNTALILTADHGMKHTPVQAVYDLRRHPALDQCLHMITGENRLTYLYIRPGCVDNVRQYFRKTWPGQFVLLTPEEAVSAGLFGPGKQHPRLMERLGDLIAIARDDAYIWWGKNQNALHGRHGGLHPDEMLIPFLGVRW